MHIPSNRIPHLVRQQISYKKCTICRRVFFNLDKFILNGYWRQYGGGGGGVHLGWGWVLLKIQCGFATYLHFEPVVSRIEIPSVAFIRETHTCANWA